MANALSSGDISLHALTYVAVHLLTFLVYLYKMRRHFKIDGDETLKSKYGPFCRIDLDKVKVLKTFPWFLIFWPRIIFGVLQLTFFGILTHLITLGVDLDKEKLSPLRWKIVKWASMTCAKITLILGGGVWVNKQHVSTEEGNYSKWLGPDWKPEWEGAGTIVSNHISWMDILVFLSEYCPSFISKMDVKNYYMIGHFAKAIGSFFVERTGTTKEEKMAALKKIEDHQAKMANENGQPLIIFPEAATTNGEQVITFKKGPFSGLNPVQPFGIKYSKSLSGFSPQNESSFLLNPFFSICAPAWVVNLKVYPVFKPN